MSRETTYNEVLVLAALEIKLNVAIDALKRAKECFGKIDPLLYGQIEAYQEARSMILE